MFCRLRVLLLLVKDTLRHTLFAEDVVVVLTTFRRVDVDLVAIPMRRCDTVGGVEFV